MTNGPAKPPLRLGADAPTRTPWPWKWIAVGLGALALIVFTIVLVVASVSSDDGPIGSGCATNEDCGPGQACALGGCLLLIEGELPEVWATELAEQFDAGANWQAQHVYGERLIETERCPAPAGNLPKTDERHLVTLLRINVIEVGAVTLRGQFQARVKGDIWVDSLRISLPPVLGAPPVTLCAANNAVTVSPIWARRPGQMAEVDVKTDTSVPAGTAFETAISAEGPAPALGQEGLATLTLPLAGSRGGRAVTAVAFPLGSSVLKIDGQAPQRQRLLRGWTVYYFEHGPVPREVTFRYRAAATPTTLMPWTEIAP